ncbi:MAG: hypothetical protein KW793_02900 [Candidatus Doudnabacteria bacterium]|nr:hypothetical protein [Candidatus Doudnabacteria bacterium]
MPAKKLQPIEIHFREMINTCERLVKNQDVDSEEINKKISRAKKVLDIYSTPIEKIRGTLIQILRQAPDGLLHRDITEQFPHDYIHEVIEEIHKLVVSGTFQMKGPQFKLFLRK